MAQVDGFGGLINFATAVGDIPNNIRASTANRAAKVAIRPAVKYMKAKMKEDSATHTRGKGFSKLLLLARSIKVYTVKGYDGFGNRNIGAAARFNDNTDIDMGARRWTVQGAGKLFAEGAYKNPGRKGHGYFGGFGNWAVEAMNALGGTISNNFQTAMVKELEKAAARSIKKRGLNG